MYQKRSIEELSLIPFRSEIRSYSRNFLRKDLFASLCIACISIPQALGYSLIANLPPMAGLISVCIGTMIGALFTSSSHLVLGPNNVSALLLQATLIDYMRDLQALSDRPLSFIELTALLAFLIGAIQLIFACCRVGKLVQFVSHSVITGYILGTALALAVGQIFPLIGIACPNHLSTIYEKVSYLCTHLYTCNPYTLSIGLLSIALIVLLHHLKSGLPPSLVVLITVTPLSYCIGLTSTHPFQIENLSGLLQHSAFHIDSPSIPYINWSLINSLLPTAFAIALIGILEANSIARSIATKTGQWINPNQESLALGWSNVIVSFFSGMPCSGSASRSSINENNGGTTRFSAFVSGILVATLALIVSPYIQYIPKACLAAILCTAALRLIDVSQVLLCLKATHSDALVFITTFLSCIFLSLSLAFYIGIALAIFLYLRKASTPHLEEFVYHEATEEFWPKSEGKIVHHPQIRIINVEGELFFGSTDLFQGTLRAIADDDSRTCAIIIRIKHVHDVDATTAIALKQLKSYLLQRKTHLIICSVPKQVVALLEKTDLVTLLGKDNIISLDEHHPKGSLRIAWKRALVLIEQPDQSPQDLFNKSPVLI